MHASTDIQLRPARTVMRLTRMGAAHQTRLSFMRVLLRRLQRDAWSFERTLWSVDETGVGTALYQARGPERTYTLVAFAHDLDPSMRSDRVIAEAWDATFTLFDGVPDANDIERLRAQVPLQEAGHISERELTLARANRSVRLFEHVRDCLAAGEQPSAEALTDVGYLMRTTAVYGSGKFGALDRRFIADREEFSAPFQVELLSVFLIRAFTVDIVEHLAHVQAPHQAVRLSLERKRLLGVGNSTGLGMAPFFIKHPQLIHCWMLARETALAKVRALPEVTPEQWHFAGTVLERMQADLPAWRTDHTQQQERVRELESDAQRLGAYMASSDAQSVARPWDALYRYSEQNLSLEAQELTVSLLLECHPDLVDDLADNMSTDEGRFFAIDGQQTVGELQDVLSQSYAYTREFDFQTRAHTARFWYVSEEKLEPRLGERFDEPGAEREHPLAIARDIRALWTALEAQEDDTLVATFLQQHPEHRHVVRRAQRAPAFPYAEIQDNVIADVMQPIDILRCKLAFFGATKFDPRSDRWVRITMFQNAPFPDNFSATYSDDWVYPDVA